MAWATAVESYSAVLDRRKLGRTGLPACGHAAWNQRCAANGDADAPLQGVVVVTSPQDMARSVVKKAYHMANQLQVPVLGLVENMSYAVCPHCGERFSVFGQKPLSEAAKEFNVQVCAEMPLDPQLAKLTDKGDIEHIGENITQTLQSMVEALASMP